MFVQWGYCPRGLPYERTSQRVPTAVIRSDGRCFWWLHLWDCNNGRGGHRRGCRVHGRSDRYGRNDLHFSLNAVFGSSEFYRVLPTMIILAYRGYFADRLITHVR
jgi:hypothetical protein